jgi:hypothetical protein
MKPVNFTTREMEITNVMQRTVEETGKNYVVIKAWPDMASTSCFYNEHKKRRQPITFVCFIEGLFPVLETEAVYSFHGDVEFRWGATYFSITKLYDQEGKRVLRKKDADIRSVDLSKIPF